MLVHGDDVQLHVGFTVGTFVIFKITILGDELVGFLPLPLLQHRVAHLYVFAAQLVSGQELHDAGADGIPQDVGRGTKSVPAHQPGTESTDARRLFLSFPVFIPLCLTILTHSYSDGRSHRTQ